MRRCPTIAFVLLSVAAASLCGSPPAFAADTAATRPDHDYQICRATQEVFRSVAAAMRPVLVRIETVGGSQPRDFAAPGPLPERGDPQEKRKRSQNPFRDVAGSDFVIADGATTGIIYSSDGYIITSSFNFIREPVLISVTLSDGRRLAADLIARDQVRKVALLKVEAVGLPTPQWAAVEDISVGEWAVSLGLGFGAADPSVTVGIVSALNRMSGNAIQTDAKLSPANYGGPVCDVHGRILGMAVPMAQRPGELAGVEMYDAGVGFAIPKDRLEEIVNALKSGRSFYRGWLGMQMEAGMEGAVVVKKLADPSPLRAAGVVPGDKITAAAGKPIRHFGHLMQALYMLPAGEAVDLEIERAGIAFSTRVTLARNTELGPLPEAEEPFDPSTPVPEQPKSDE